MILTRADLCITLPPLPRVSTPFFTAALNGTTIDGMMPQKKEMKMKNVIVPLLLAVSVASPALSVTRNVDFSFGGGTGTFYGLGLGDVSTSAATYSFSSGGYTYSGTTPFLSNAFTFTDGKLTSINFIDGTTRLPASGDKALVGFTVTGSGGSFFGQATMFDTVNFTVDSISGGATVSMDPPPLVPLPASLFTLASGSVLAFFGVALLRRRLARK